MGSAQGFGVTLNGGRVLIVDANPAHVERRLRDGWIDLATASYDEALAAHLDPVGPGAVGLVGNAAEVVPRLLEYKDPASTSSPTRPLPTTRSRDTSRSAGRRPPRRPPTRSDLRFRDAVRDSLKAHAEALLGFRDTGAVVFEYGNGIRAQAAARSGSWVRCPFPAS